jgi:hypothetical protein
MLAYSSFERDALRERFRGEQRAHTDVTARRARLDENIAQSRELMAQADFLLTLPYLIKRAAKQLCRSG